uniref:Coiled-coil domain-containing protein 93 n=1 Tax=Cyclopterus lumpus TaxID=8103 RepID=A0A8C2XB01_CYCLU
MAAATSVFHRVRTGSNIGAQYDQDGNLIQVETREDEEQSVKLAETLELLLAAGYFRARIKGLSPFDKVVGGMTWCITTCNFDIDVDLLFQENSTIGQKIALTEKIVSVLPKMKCPHRLEPHQIQGLDFIHIFPVIQWLVKRAIETREEMGDYVRAYSISQFQKTHSLPEDEEFLQRKDEAARTVLDEVYKPQRKYRRQRDAGQLLDEESRVHSTLLEYALMTSMAAMANEEGKLTVSAVGQIVGLQSEEIKQIVSEYAEKQSELSSEERSERYGPLQQHRRAVVSLNKQIQQKTKQLQEVSCDSMSTPIFSKHLITTRATVKSTHKFVGGIAETNLYNLCILLITGSTCRLGIILFYTYLKLHELWNLKRFPSYVQARRNREIAILQRKIDEVPSRAELTQYQKRFIELYSQVSATHKETKQFFTLYNTLHDKKVYLEKEVNLLNSIHDNFHQAMSSSAAKEQFLRQMEQIVEGIKQSRIKMEKKKQENKMRRDQLNDEYLELLDKQRLYFKTVKDFKEVRKQFSMSWCFSSSG